MFRRYAAVFFFLFVASLTCAGPAAAQSGLVAAYGFNEGTGTTAADASGNANTGTLGGGPAWTAAGRFGGALTFDGVNDWVTIPHRSVLNLTGAMTLEAWVYPTSVGAWRTVLLKDSPSGLSYALYGSDTNRHPSAYIRRSSDIDVTAVSAISTNTWVHLAATYNGSTFILYVNGAQVVSKAVTGSIVTSTQALHIGGSALWGEYFAGRIDEVRIYNRALTPTEIQTDMNTAVGPAAPADFSISATPGSRTINQGGSTTYTVSVGAHNGFAGTVSLSASGLPANTTASFSPATVSGAGGSTLTVSTAASTPVGSPTLTLTGASGTLTRTTTVGLVVNAAPVPDFTIAAAPASRSVTQGSGTTYTVTTTAANGFNAAVNLAVSGLPPDATASFDPPSITGAGSSTLTVTTAADTPTGSPTLAITGTSGSLSHTTGATLVVNAAPVPDFSVSVTPGSRSVTQGDATTYSVTTTAVHGFTGTVDLAVGGVPPDATAWFSPATLAGSGSATLTVTTTASTPAATSTLAISGTSGSLSHSATASLVVSAPTAARTIGINFVGTGVAMGATESAGVVPTRNWNNATGASRTTALALADETGAASGATATWSSNNTRAVPITDQAGNRRLMRGYIDTSDTSTTTVTVAGLPDAAYDVYVYGDGDNGTSARTAAYRISGTGITTTTINATDAANTNFNATFRQATNSNGNYVKFSVAARGFTLTATPAGSSGTRRAPVNAVQIVPTAPPAPDFSMASTPVSRTVTQGGETTYTVTTAALNGFADAIDLAISGLPADTIATLTPTSVAGTGNATLTVTTSTSTPPGSSALTITGSGGSLTHTNTVTLAVNATPVLDFAVTVTPSTRTATQGTGTTYSIAVTPMNGFAGSVDLSALGLPANASATFTPPSINSSGTSTMDVAIAANSPAGTSTITVAGTSGAVMRSASASLVVVEPTRSMSGEITPSAAGAAASINLGGPVAATTTTDAAGAFTFAGLTSGSYLVTPSKTGFTFSPASRTVAVSSSDVAGVDFTAAQSPNTISLTSPANGASVSSAFSMSATASASIVAVQFQVDDVDVGPVDTTAPYSVAVTAPSGGHRLRAIGRDASGNTVTSASVNVTVSAGSGTALSINGGQTYQTIDGFGVNINSLSWKNGQLAAALDRLADEVGVKTWRVVFDMTDWESTNDNDDPNTPNWTYYNALYSNAKFQNLWGTLRYLNQKGVMSGIALSFMGRVPTWMGGSVITSTTAMEDEFVEMVSTLVYYARNTEHVQFDLLDPMNEPDWDGFEGPKVGETQYTRLLEKLSVKLDAMGLGDVKFLGPNTADVAAGVDRYIPKLLGNSVVMAKLDHFGLHNYSGQTGGADARIKGSASPQKNFWMTELSIPTEIFTMIGQGAAAVQIWDAYDSVYNHAILAGRGSTPPNDAGNWAALLAYNASSGIYTARPQFYQMQTFKYVTPGSIRIGAAESNSNLTVYAFRHPTSGQLTLVGRNIGASSITLSGSLSNVGSIGALHVYATDIGNSYNSFTRRTDAAVTNGAFIVTVPANSFFTLTTAGQ